MGEDIYYYDVDVDVEKVYENRRGRLQMAAVGPAEARDDEDEGVMMVMNDEEEEPMMV